MDLVKPLALRSCLKSNNTPSLRFLSQNCRQDPDKWVEIELRINKIFIGPHRVNDAKVLSCI